jgi:hypothetical protein
MKTVVKREKGRVDLFGERFRARAHQLSPRLLAVVSYINENREAVLERTAMEIAPRPTPRTPRWCAPSRRSASPDCGS